MVPLPPPSVAFFGAHPDDIEIFGLGLLLCLRQYGWTVDFVIATDGAAANGAADTELAATRREEAECAAARCGARLHMLGVADGGLAHDPRGPALVAERLSDIAPTLCLTHHPRDYHPDHRAISRLVTNQTPAHSALLFAEPLFGIGPMPDLVVDITAVFDAKIAALGEHASQDPDLLTRGVEIWNRFRALQLLSPGITRAEGFALPADTAARIDPTSVLPGAITVRRFRPTDEH